MALMIYIDESGTFTLPAWPKPSMSCVVGAVIPGSVHREVLDRFVVLRDSWGGSGEVKGRSLNEGQIASVVDLLVPYDIVLEVVAIEMSTQSQKGLLDHQRDQSDMLMRDITAEYAPTLVAQVREVQQRLSSLSLQLYTQAVTTWELISNIIRITVLYYVQRRPRDLDAFHWCIDGKARARISEYDSLWSLLVLPFLQSKSLREPIIHLEGADYSAFDRFNRVAPEAPEHLRDRVGNARPFHYTDINLLVREHLEYASASTTVGLQIADILANALRRAMNGNLQRTGWQSIGKLMVQHGADKQVVSLVDLSGSRSLSRDAPYWTVIPHLDASSKRMIAA